MGMWKASTPLSSAQVTLTAEPPIVSAESLPTSSRTIVLKQGGVGGAGSILRKTTFNDSATSGLSSAEVGGGGLWNEET